MHFATIFNPAVTLSFYAAYFEAEAISELVISTTPPLIRRS